MRQLAVKENQSIPIGLPDGVSETEARALRRLDEDHHRRTGGTVFDWSRSTELVARDYVGVVCIPGLTLEILPKIDDPEGEHLAQKNLLYMLELAGAIRPKDRSLGHLDTEPVSLLDAFVIVFADSLIDALRDGVDRNYVTIEENLKVVRGRLLVHEQIRRNAVQKQNLYVRYDEFSADTGLNRILKAACRSLARSAGSFSALRRLRELLVRFDEVTDFIPTPADLRLELTRQNRRFQPHLDFARLVLGGQSPAPMAGGERSFSLLFKMHVVFEAFVGEFLRRHAHTLGLQGTRIIPQAQGRALARDEAGERHFYLRPDILVLGPAKNTRLVVDTKWKLVDPSTPVDDVSREDAYQLFAYSERFNSPLSVLLYPRTGPANPMTLTFEQTSRVLRLAFMDVGRDLRKEAEAVAQELAGVLSVRTIGPNH
ncbi:McrC family protein [Myxococcota bacterium]